MIPPIVNPPKGYVPSKVRDTAPKKDRTEHMIKKTRISL